MFGDIRYEKKPDNPDPSEHRKVSNSTRAVAKAQDLSQIPKPVRLQHHSLDLSINKKKQKQTIKKPIVLILWNIRIFPNVTMNLWYFTFP